MCFFTLSGRKRLQVKVKMKRLTDCKLRETNTFREQAQGIEILFLTLKKHGTERLQFLGGRLYLGMSERYFAEFSKYV